MSMNMSDMTTETLKSYVIADRMSLLNAIEKDIAGVSDSDAVAFLRSFDKRLENYMSIPMPQVSDKKRKKKVARFRKVSPYLAFCANYRDSKRDKNGKLPKFVEVRTEKGKSEKVSAVLEFTRQAGAQWKKMTETQRKPWVAKAEELTVKSREAWDKKMKSEASPPTEEAIREMKKADVTKLVNKTGVVIPNKASLKDMKEVLVAHFYPKNIVPPAPSQEEIGKMKKAELLSLIEKAGITSKKDTKTMQRALISHYYP